MRGKRAKAERKAGVRTIGRRQLTAEQQARPAVTIPAGMLNVGDTIEVRTSGTYK